jgi:hypothetical protein
LIVPQPVTTPSPGSLSAHAEVGAAVLDEHVELFERAFIQQQFDTLARRQLAARVLRLNALFTTAKLGNRAAVLQLFENFLHETACSLPCHRLVTGRSSSIVRCGKSDVWVCEALWHTAACCNASNSTVTPAKAGVHTSSFSQTEKLGFRPSPE